MPLIFIINCDTGQVTLSRYSPGKTTLRLSNKMDEPLIIALLQEEEDLLLAAAALIVVRRLRRKRAARAAAPKTAKARSCWVKPWLLRRTQFGQYERLMVELAAEDRTAFRNFLRVDPELFQELLDRVGPIIEKKDTFMRKALEPGLRLAITLRYLATGDSYMTLQYGFRVAHNTISNIVADTCEAISAVLQDEVLKCPTSPAEWQAVSDQFSRRWNFHNTIGALDGKHVAICCPANAGSIYYNYKGFHSIVLLALVDADYKFLFIDLGANGRLVQPASLA